MSDKFVFTFHNKTIDQLTKEELMECLTRLVDSDKRTHAYTESTRNERLQMELRIKDEIIDKFFRLERETK
jgi:hypothetical protein